MADDKDRKDTQVHGTGNAPFDDMEGTAEMDRAALLRRLQADQKSPREPAPTAPPARDSGVVVSAHKTEQNPSVKDPTQHYVVPDHLIRQSRLEESNTLEVTLEPIDDNDEDLPTATFSMDALLEFDAVVDPFGRIALPESALKGRFAVGTRLKVVVHAVDDPSS